MTAGSAPSSSLSFTANNQPVGYTFDPSGNMTMEPLIPQQNYMTYDGENHMTAVSGNTAASYGYDGNGMRVVKSIQGGTTTVSIYAGSSVIAEYDNGAAPGTPSREYIYNPAGAATTGLLAMISGGATTYYHQDHESVRLVTDASGNVLTQEGTYPFGEPWYTAGQSNKWMFTSYQRDAETGLDYALARYYDSRTGTFCSADPLAGSPGDPQSWNRYPYGRNNPISITDPSGQSWWSDLLIGVGVGAAMFFAPAIEGELNSFFPTLFEGAGAPAGFAPTLIPGALRTVATTGVSIGADVGASAGSALGPAIAAGTMGAAAGQSTDRTKNPESQHLSDAMTIATQALNKKPCADMYGTPQTRANGFTPQNVLSGIVNGNKYGKLVWQNAGKADWVAKTTPGFPFIPGLASSVTLKINTFGGAGYWGSGNAADNAQTLLHELGHAFNFIRGAGGFPVSNLAEIKDPYAFDKEVKKNCF